MFIVFVFLILLCFLRSFWFSEVNLQFLEFWIEMTQNTCWKSYYCSLLILTYTFSFFQNKFTWPSSLFPLFTLIKLMAAIIFISIGVIASFFCAIVDGIIASEFIVSITCIYMHSLKRRKYKVIHSSNTHSHTRFNLTGGQKQKVRTGTGALVRSGTCRWIRQVSASSRHLTGKRDQLISASDLQIEDLTSSFISD